MLMCNAVCVFCTPSRTVMVTDCATLEIRAVSRPTPASVSAVVPAQAVGTGWQTGVGFRGFKDPGCSRFQG